MRELLQFARDVLLFKHEAYIEHATRDDVLKRGLTLLVLVTLVAGSLSLIVNLVNDLRLSSVEARRQEMEQALREFTRTLQTMQRYFDVPPGFERDVLRYVQPSMKIAFRIAELPTPLPKPVGAVLSNLGLFLSSPFNRISGWIGYVIWVLLIAKLLGGRATTSQTLGATALYSLPHVLDILSPVNCLGGLLGLVATVWGIAIYVKALAVANEFSIVRSVVATVVPALIAAILVGLGLLTILVLSLVNL